MDSQYRSVREFDPRLLDAISNPYTYRLFCEKMKNADPFGIGFWFFFMLTSDKRRGLADTDSCAWLPLAPWWTDCRCCC